MHDLDELRRVFRTALALPGDYDVDGLEYRAIDKWDSLAHMALIASLEDAFDVMIDTDDVIGLSSFSEARKILATHDVEFTG